MPSRRDFLKYAGITTAAITSGCRGISEVPAANNPGQPSGSLQTIDHIIFTMQENRSFDHYFGKMPEYRRMNNLPDDVDGLQANASNPARDDPSQLVQAYHLQTECHENLSPGWNESHRQWNRNDPTSDIGTLDGFVFTAANFSRNRQAAGDLQYVDTEGRRAMGFYDWTDIPYYYALASQFAMSDRHFCSVMAATVPNRMYLLSGSSHGHEDPLRAQDTIVNAKTIFELCEEHGISWRVYLNHDGPRPFSFYQMFSGYLRNTTKVVPAEQFFTDLASGHLPQVVHIESGVDTGMDEHPLNHIQKGAAYMKRFFDAIMASQIWTKSITVLTYDEAGGFYDHVPPPPAPKPDDIEPQLDPGDTPGSFDRYSFRVPLIVVSPWVKPHYVSHQVTDHTSILKLIERRFGLPSLTRRDAAAHDFLDMFDFSKMSWETPPPLPDQPTGGACNFNLV